MDGGTRHLYNILTFTFVYIVYTLQALFRLIFEGEIAREPTNYRYGLAGFLFATVPISSGFVFLGAFAAIKKGRGFLRENSGWISFMVNMASHR